MFNFIKKMKKKKEYKTYLKEHKKNIIKAFNEIVSCKDLEWIVLDPEIVYGLWERVLKHDVDEANKKTFEIYRRNFYPISKEEWKLNRENFLKEREHHKMINDHHWESRVNWKNEDFDTKTELACLENLIDWLAIGYELNERPYKYYDKHKDSLNLPGKQREFLEKCIYQGIDKNYILEEQQKEGK